MFYTFLLLGKRGALSKIWIAAHWDKKLTKAHIFDCNLESAIQSIMTPKVVIALRTSGHLLLGVVRIYHRKTKYLLADCNEALLKIRITFRPGALDLVEDNQEAGYNAITLAEEFHEFDIPLPDLNLIDVVDHFTLNQSRVEDITIREDYGRQLIFPDRFGEDLDTFRQNSTTDISFEVSSSSFLPEQSSAIINGEDRDLFTQDCFGDEGVTTNFFDNNQLFVESIDLCADKHVSKEVLFPASPSTEEADLSNNAEEMSLENHQAVNTTSLLINEEDGFVLEPVDVSEIEKRKRIRRKRKLMVDHLKEIPSAFMCQQMIDFSDTLTHLDIAPPMHSLMEGKLTGGVQWLLSHPTQPIINTDLLLLFTQSQRLETPRGAQGEQAESEIETIRQEQGGSDLPQLEVTRLTDVSSSYTEEPRRMDDMTAYIQTATDVSDYLQQEYVEPLLNNSRLNEEVIEPTTESVQDSDEHRWNKRTQEMLRDLRKLSQSGVSSFSLQKLCKKNGRKQVSAKFYSFLVLEKQSAIKMAQNAPYSDIIAVPGPRFHTL